MQGIVHHLGRAERLDMCLLIPVLRFQESFGLDRDSVVMNEDEKRRLAVQQVTSSRLSVCVFTDVLH